MKHKISTVAIYSALGEISIQRGYGKPRSYRYSWRRAGLMRSTILMGYQYKGFATWAYEKYSILKPLPAGLYH